MNDITQALAHVVGLDIVIDAGSPLYLAVVISQKDYGLMWVWRFRETLNDPGLAQEKIRPFRPAQPRSEPSDDELEHDVSDGDPDEDGMSALVAARLFRVEDAVDRAITFDIRRYH